MKKLTSLLLICLLLTLSACAGNGTLPAETTGASAEPKQPETTIQGDETMTENTSRAKLLYMGHASLRITTAEGKVIYIDPYAGDGYAPTADLILVTHSHFDHTQLDKIENRAPDCRIITWKEALKGGKHQTFDLGYVTVEAVEAGYNRNHNVKDCVGYVLTLADGVSVYVSGDTSETKQMARLADRQIDYAFFCCDGIYNMGPQEASKCAALVGAKHNIPYHVIAAGGSVYFDRAAAERFTADNRLILDAGEDIELQ